MIDEIQDYWNHRIHDLEMTDQPVGTKAFFDDLDDYRFDKLHYLPQLVDFSSFRASGCSRWAAASAPIWCGLRKGGARVTGVDLAQTAIDLARKNFELNGVAAEELRVANGEALAVPGRELRCRLRHGVIQYTADPRAADSRVSSRAEAGRHGDLHGLQPRVVAERAVEGDEGGARARRRAGAEEVFDRASSASC